MRISIRHPVGEKAPPRITEKRLAELLPLLRDGTITKAQRDEIAHGHIRLAIAIAARFAVRCPHKSDIIVAEALFGLVQALDKAATTLIDDNFAALAHVWISGTINRYLRNDGKIMASTTTVDEHKKNGTESTLPFVTHIKSHPPSRNYTPLRELKDMVQHCIKFPMEREVITMREEGYNDQEIAEKLGVTQQRINKIKLAVKRRFTELEKALA